MRAAFSLIVLLGLALALPAPVQAKKKTLMSRPASKPPVYKKPKQDKDKRNQVHWGTPKR